MPDFKLSAQLRGHDADVRAVCFPQADTVISSSRDNTVRVWRSTSASPPAFDASIITQGQGFINSLAYLRPSPDHPDGLVVSGGQDTIIEARKPTATASDNADRLLLGHAHNVCALDASPSNKWLVSGGWDGQCRLWPVGKWETDQMLVHDAQKSVWAVLALDDHTVVTGSADQKIRVFDLRRADGSGSLEPRTVIAAPDIVRALCKLPTGPKGHPSGADFASASNDGVIRLWKLSGQQVGELHGHDSFIYSLACLPSGEIVSAGEDRTARVWSGYDCVQTITHPAISVWSVAVCPVSGDIATGASDSVVRVFSRRPERAADAAVLEHFNESVRASAIPQQQLGTKINPEKLDRPDWLAANQGNKDGQVKMIREADGSVTAHQWSQGEQKWMAVGTVVDSAASGSKEVYQGKEYDHVFKVDVEDGKPPLVLPYNLSENPYDAATRFLAEHELPVSYLESVAGFIVKNSRGATIGQESSESEQPAAQPPKKSYLPHVEFITLTQTRLEPIRNKILNLNSALVQSGDKQFALNPTEESVLDDLVDALNAASSQPAGQQDLDISDAAITLVIKLATQWEYPSRLPGLDLLRCIAVSPLVAQRTAPGGETVLEAALSAALDPEPDTLPINDNSIMMALRTVTNLFASRAGRRLAGRHADVVFSAMERIAEMDKGGDPASNKRNLYIALVSAAFNYACLAYMERKGGDSDEGDDDDSDGLDGLDGEPAVSDDFLILLSDALSNVLARQTDGEVLYRALMALGMVLSASDQAVDMVRSMMADEWIKKAMAATAEPRVKDVGQECLALLGA